MTHLTGIHMDTLFSSEESFPPGYPESLSSAHGMTDTWSHSGISEIFFPAKMNSLFNE